MGYKMKCQKCGDEFEEKDIHVSHDVPKYMGGTDVDGRHHLCQKCHNIYEKIAFSVAFKELDEVIKKECRKKVKAFSISYFNNIKKNK